jgi:RNA polymerase sigma-70 factor (ECF subfamily)
MSNPPLKDRCDEELIQQLRDGCTEALGVLFDRHFRLIFHVANKILRDRGEAEDLMQEVFLEIFRDAAKFDPSRGSGRTWILQYAYHRSLNRKKYLNVRGFYEEIPASTPVVASDDHQRGLTNKEWERVIRAGMKVLTENERRTLELACFEGMLLREIATSLRESLPRVRNYYYRGLKKLRNELILLHSAKPKTTFVEAGRADT